MKRLRLRLRLRLAKKYRTFRDRTVNIFFSFEQYNYTFLIYLSIGIALRQVYGLDVVPPALVELSRFSTQREKQPEMITRHNG